MPLLTPCFLKTAMFYFVASSCLGGYLLVAVGLQRTSPLVLQPVYWHMLLVGWLMQLIFRRCLLDVPALCQGAAAPQPGAGLACVRGAERRPAAAGDRRALARHATASGAGMVAGVFGGAAGGGGLDVSVHHLVAHSRAGALRYAKA